MIFYRIHNNQLYNAGEVNKLGFPITDPSYIPDEYLKQKEFVILRTGFAYGDWAIISAIPKILKMHYEGCKVYIPSAKFCEKLFGDMNAWGQWSDPFETPEIVFKNNPHIDGFIDEYEGEVFHDHYRLYDPDDTEIPLIKQMLAFWQVNTAVYDEKQYQPELFFTKEEKASGDKIIKEYIGNNTFGSLMLSERYKHSRDYKYIKSIVDAKNWILKDIPWVYWTYKPLEDTPFDYINAKLDLRNIDIRMQQYIRSKAAFNVGNQCGVTDALPRYTQVNTVAKNYKRIKENLVPGIIYLPENKRVLKTDKGKEYTLDDVMPVTEDQFLNMGIAGGGGGKELITLDGKLKTVREVVDYYKDPNNLQDTINKLNPDNWQYFNCLLAGFKHDIDGHHDLGWDKLTTEYYQSKPDMSNTEISRFLRFNVVGFEANFVKHGYHRACAMIGRLIRGEKYIYFWMLKENAYCKPDCTRTHQHIFSPVDNISGIGAIKNFPDGSYTIVQSGILALMGIRKNDDLDIVISSDFRDRAFRGRLRQIKIGNIEIFPKHTSKFMKFGCKNNEDLIRNYSYKIEGCNFLQPRFYFQRKNWSNPQGQKDLKLVKEFFDKELHKTYPYCNIPEIYWGLEYIP